MIFLSLIIGAYFLVQAKYDYNNFTIFVSLSVIIFTILTFLDMFLVLPLHMLEIQYIYSIIPAIMIYFAYFVIVFLPKNQSNRPADILFVSERFT